MIEAGVRWSAPPLVDRWQSLIQIPKHNAKALRS